MSLLNSQLYNHFKEKKAVKVIAGLNNTNISQITKITQAAELANASYIDICANTQIVKLLKSVSYLPICISSIEPVDIYNCVLAGADMVEVGNYDYFYDKGIYINSSNIIDLVKEIKRLIGHTLMCVTVPYHLSLTEQINLAQNLESLGVDIVQTEGLHYSKSFKSLYHNVNSSYHLNCPNALSTSLLSTYMISKSIELPVITASGVTDIFTACANLYGASGVGIASAVHKKKSIFDMAKYIHQVKNALVNSRKFSYIYSAKNYHI